MNLLCLLILRVCGSVSLLILRVYGSDSGGGVSVDGNSGGGDSSCGDSGGGDEDSGCLGGGDPGGGDSGDCGSGGDDSGGGDSGDSVPGGSDSGGGVSGGSDSDGHDSGGGDAGGGDSCGGDSGSCDSNQSELLETGAMVPPALEPKAGSTAKPLVERDSASSTVNASAAQLIDGDTAEVTATDEGRHGGNITEDRSAIMDLGSSLLTTVPWRIRGSVESLGQDRDPSNVLLLVMGWGGNRHFKFLATRDTSCRDFLEQVSKSLGEKLQFWSLGRLVPWIDCALLDFLGPNGRVLTMLEAVVGGAPPAQEPSDPAGAEQGRQARYNLRARQMQCDSDEAEGGTPLCSIYELGNVPEQDERKWRKLLSGFHADQDLADK